MNTKTKKYRFFYHYNKKEGKITVHYRKRCIHADNILCEVATESKWNKIQPHLVMQGFATEVKVLNSNLIHIK